MNKKFIIFFILLLLSTIISVAHAGFSVETYSPPAGSFDASGTDNLVSFFDLPLWIQISWITGCILGILGLITLWPFILSRIQNVLKSENRLTLLQYIGNNPGCTITDLSNGTGINRGTVKYHLYMLLAQRKIVRRKSGRVSYLFTNGGMQLEKKQIYGYIRNPAKRQILSEILTSPGISNKEIAKKLQLGRSTVHWHLQQLLDEKIVVGRWDGRNMNYVLLPDVEDILREYQE